MKINELEDLLGVSKATVRYYEDQGLVKPLRMENGYRDYSDEEVQLFQKIIVLRKLGLGIPEIRNLIEGKTDLHDALAYNIERLRTRQDEITSAIDLCRKVDAEAGDFASIDSPKYLKHIYENEQKGAHFAETKEISVRQLNLAITLLGMLAGTPVIQNKQFSEHSNEPLPADIRANKKEGDEYTTIGTVLEKGGKLKAVLIAVLLIYLALGIWNGFTVWGGLGSAGKYVHDFNKSGITVTKPDDEELAQIAALDPEAVEAAEMSELFRFHTNKGLTVTLKGPADEEWAELDRKEISAKSGYLFITGEPSSELELHIVADGKSIKYNAGIFDSTHKKEGTGLMVNSYQEPLNKECVIVLFHRGDDPWNGVDDYDLFIELLAKTPPDGCYAVTVREAE